MKLHHKFFVLLLIFLPTQLAIHFWPSWALVSGIKVDYLSPTIYLTDILILLILISWRKFPIKYIKIIFAVLIFALFNIFSASVYQLALFRWLKIFEMMYLGFWVYSNFEWVRGVVSKFISVPVIYSSVIAIMQFINKGTLGGVFYWLGERSFNITTPGISLFNIFGKSFLRPYGTFGHPNSLAGFLVITLLILLTKSKKSYLDLFAIIVGLIAFLLTFSQNAWIVFLISILLLKFKDKISTKFIKVMFFLIILFSLILPVVSHILLNSGFAFPDNISKRLVLNEIAGIIFSQHPFGIGLNNFISYLPRVDFDRQIIWWLQPVHNIFLLVLVETGIVGLLGFVFTLLKLFSKKFSIYTILLLAILLTGIADHYTLTLQQNLILFVLIFTLSLKYTNERSY